MSPTLWHIFAFRQRRFASKVDVQKSFVPFPPPKKVWHFSFGKIYQSSAQKPTCNMPYALTSWRNTPASVWNSNLFQDIWFMNIRNIWGHSTEQNILSFNLQTHKLFAHFDIETVSKYHSSILLGVFVCVCVRVWNNWMP